MKTPRSWRVRTSTCESATQTFSTRQPAERHRRRRTGRSATRRFTFDAAAVTPEAFAPIFARIDDFVDTTDFDVLYLLNLWYGYGDELPPETRDAIEQRLLAFKYWYTEPTPAGLVDDQYYWSENHRIIFHVDEYLAGHAFPDATFANDGRTGAEHARRSPRRASDDWLDEKVRFGFTEWHSDVYYQKDVTPLLTLVEFAPDSRPREPCRDGARPRAARHRAAPAAAATSARRTAART